MGAVWCGGFVPGRGLRMECGRKIYFVGRYFAPTQRNRPEYKYVILAIVRRGVL